jgi:hypothetical protein
VHVKVPGTAATALPCAAVAAKVVTDFPNGRRMGLRRNAEIPAKDSVSLVAGNLPRTSNEVKRIGLHFLQIA